MFAGLRLHWDQHYSFTAEKFFKHRQAIYWSHPSNISKAYIYSVLAYYTSNCVFAKLPNHTHIYHHISFIYICHHRFLTSCSAIWDTAERRQVLQLSPVFCEASIQIGFNPKVTPEFMKGLSTTYRGLIWTIYEPYMNHLFNNLYVAESPWNFWW